MTLNDAGTLFAVIIGLVNAVAIWVRIGHETRLKMAELALRMGELEVKRALESNRAVSIFAPHQYLDFYLPAIQEIHNSGTLDIEKFNRETGAKMDAYRKAEKKMMNERKDRQSKER